jgi:glycosyltransferase involved in cell wall biosynthesis
MRLHVAVAGWLLDDTPSGANRRLLGLVRAAAPRLAAGEELTLLHRDDANVPAIEGVRLRAVELPAEPAWRRAGTERRVLPRLLEGLGATVLELGHLPVPPRLPCPATLTLHDLRDLGPFRRRPRWVARRTLRTALQRVVHVTVPSRSTEQQLRAELGEPLPPITVVPNGVDERFFGARPGADAGYLLHVGHLEPRKNLLLLVSALAQVCEHWPADQPRPRLRLAGADQGAADAVRERAAMLELGGNVELLGLVPDEELPALYAGAAAVLVPSLVEGFGMAALEGLAAGVPVLVSDRGALPEVVGDAGQVLPGEDATAWAAALEAVLRGPDAAGARERRIARARELSWEASAARMLEIWRTLSRASG